MSQNVFFQRQTEDSTCSRNDASNKLNDGFQEIDVSIINSFLLLLASY